MRCPDGSIKQVQDIDAVAELDPVLLLQKIEAAHRAIVIDWKMPCTVGIR
jgi:hypothetical protein